MKKISVIGPYIMMLLSAVFFACGFQLLLIPEQLLSGGVSGVAMIIGYVSGWDIGWLYFALNVPILLWGYQILGRNFISLSIVNVIATSIAMQLLPINDITNDRVLSAVFGGVLVGLGSAITLRFGGSSGGFDIIASIISRRRDIPIGLLIIGLNALVVIALGVFQRDWNAALYSMLAIYIAGKVIDLIHTPHHKITAFIVTRHPQKLVERLLSMPRGVTILKTRGAYTQEEHDMLMTVTTRYELAELRKIIRTIDERAFVNIVQTIDVLGEFRRNN
ncbi:MAG: YitT family protein [Candidatus Cohnella colombiensis]|uniref:YitT family protein n=1 Tax=Candidatus Cohnella colombiensis TaxID=3121368 RepID=A0AA95EZ22_9BACL|nr:MAG: YitT family protein [Cohnella sp.]